ncbi:MAG: DNA repair protein RecO [Magnetococcus sp. DMHC-1]|nr:DNA repair protein RecO [Magnetococcales bacterium]
MQFRDLALVLRRTPYRDTSLVIHYLARDRGVQSVVARGIRTRKGAERATLAGFHTVNLLGVSRQSQTMGTLTQAEIIRGRHHLREVPLAMVAAQVIQEIIYRSIPPGAPHPEYFDQVETILDQLDTDQDPLGILAFFQGVTLRETGYGWRTDICVGCATDTQLAYYSVRQAQTVCQACGAPHADHLFSLNAAERQAMTTLNWSDHFVPLTPAERLNLFRIGSACLKRFGGHALNAELHFYHLLGQSASPDNQ